MPITTNVVRSGANPYDAVGTWRFFPTQNASSFSHTFNVIEMPVLLVGSHLMADKPAVVQVSGDNGRTFSDLVVFGVKTQLDTNTNIALLKLPGTFRIRCDGQPSIMGYPFTMTHEPVLSGNTPQSANVLDGMVMAVALTAFDELNKVRVALSLPPLMQWAFIEAVKGKFSTLR